MSLHYRDNIRSELYADIFGSKEADISLPKYRIPTQEMRPEIAAELVHDGLLLDGNARQNVATFCQTWLDTEIHKSMDMSIDKNMIDKDEYPATAELESRCVHMIANLWHSPEAANTMGCSTTGSSEAAMLGGLALKWKWRERMKKNGKPTDKPNLITGPVQVCWHKFARYFDIEIREIPLERNRLSMTPKEVLRRADENTIGVVPTFGVTFTCQYEPVEDVAKALDQLEKEKGLDIPIHVDGASGGFLAPFTEPELIWDFQIPRVHSINASGHKFGLAPLGVGWVVWRDAVDLPDDLIFWVNYLGGNMPTFALNFSRPGGQIVSQYYLFLRLGKDGYQRVHRNCYDTAQYLSHELQNIGPFEILFDGNSKKGIPAVSWTIKEGAEPGYNLFELSDRLRTRGWQVPAYTMPPDITDVTVIRVLVRHGFSRDMADLLLDDIRRSIDYLKKHPYTKSISVSEGSSFNHNAVTKDRLPNKH